MFFFIRHGNTDYSNRNTKIYQGFGMHLSPLSEEGVIQIKECAKDKRLTGADIILTSPYTRALQTASILSKELYVDVVVETDLHEWLANKNYVYENDAIAERYYMEYEDHHGVYPPGEDCIWESSELVRARVLTVLNRYRNYNKVIVACHGMMIQAVTGEKHPSNGEIVEFKL